jgi:hypothetical protein
MMNNHKGSEVMISILLLEILDYVAFILSATLYHGHPATKQKLWNIELTERYTSYAAGMLLHIIGKLKSYLLWASFVFNRPAQSINRRKSINECMNQT